MVKKSQKLVDVVCERPLMRLDMDFSLIVKGHYAYVWRGIPFNEWTGMWSLQPYYWHHINRSIKDLKSILWTNFLHIFFYFNIWVNTLVKAELLQLKSHPIICRSNFITKKLEIEETKTT